MSVKPGLIQPEAGSHKVVWWDPSKLDLNVEGELGLRQEKILAEDAGASLAAYRAWQSGRAEVLERGSKPEFQIFLPSLATDVPPGDAIPVVAEFTSKAEGRPSGRRFGTLVHSILRDVELDASRESIAKLATLGARSISAPAEERGSGHRRWKLLSAIRCWRGRGRPHGGTMISDHSETRFETQRRPAA